MSQTKKKACTHTRCTSLIEHALDSINFALSARYSHVTAKCIDNFQVGNSQRKLVVITNCCDFLDNAISQVFFL